MKKLTLIVLLLSSLIGISFGQLYAGEQFSASSGQDVSLDGGKLVIQPTTAFSGSCLPGRLAPFAPEMVPGTAYSIGPGAIAVTYAVTIKYNPRALPAGVAASTLRLYQVENYEWSPVTGSEVNTTTFTVTGKMTSTGTFAVLTGTPPAFENRIYYRTYLSGEATLYRALPTNLQAEPLSNLTGLAGAYMHELVVSPQRNWLCVIRYNPISGYDLYLTNIDGSNPTLLFGGWADADGIAVSSDGSTIYFGYEKVGSTLWNVVKISVATGVQTMVHSGGSTWGPSLGGGTVAFADGETITTISSTNVVSTFKSPVADGAVDNGLEVSNDGTKVIWSTDDGTVYSASIKGTGLTKLLPGSSQLGANVNPHWSPDGSMFAYESWVGGSPGLYFVSLSNLSNPTQFIGSNSNLGSAMTKSAQILGWR